MNTSWTKSLGGSFGFNIGIVGDGIVRPALGNVGGGTRRLADCERSKDRQIWSVQYSTVPKGVRGDPGKLQ